MIKERIQALIKALNLSGREFCKNVGVSDSWNRTIKYSIGSDVLVKILTAYPHVNINWLVLGKGEMFIEDRCLEAHETCMRPLINNNYKEIYEEIKSDNQDLRKENKQLRETILELMHKNEDLMVENVQLKAKALQH